MAKPTLTKTYVAGGAIAARRLVKFGANDGEVVQAAAATDSIIGVSGELTVASGDRVDVHHAGIVDIDFGGTVTRGGEVTSDANGKGVAAAPAAGANNRIGGLARASQVDGDTGELLIALGLKQG